MKLLEQILPKKFFDTNISDDDINELCKILAENIKSTNYRSLYSALMQLLTSPEQKLKVAQFYYRHLSKEHPKIKTEFLLTDLKKLVSKNVAPRPISSQPPRLLAAAKQFNASKIQIRSFLVERGFEVDTSRPTSRITAEMFEELKQNFTLKGNEPKIEEPKKLAKQIPTPVPQPLYLKNIVRKYGLIEQSVIKFLKSKGYTLKPVKGKIEITEEMLRLIKADLRNHTSNSPNSRKVFVQNINGIKDLEFSIQWKDLVFEDYQVRVRYNGGLSNPYLVKESRKSFKYITKYIQNLGLDPLQVIIKKNAVLKIQNIERLNEVVKILKIRKEFVDNYHTETSTNIHSILKHLESVPNAFLRQLAQSRSITESIEYLCDVHDNHFKIIPAIEIIASGSNFIEQDTFIFTVTRQPYVFLIWESTLKGKATYIFQCLESEMENKLQEIFDYISSDSSAKRRKLRNKLLDQDDLNSAIPINHSKFENWKAKVKSILTV
jgi:hypothetical protein